MAVGGNIASQRQKLTGFLAQFRRRFPQHCHVKTRVLAVNTRILEKCILRLDAVSASSAAVCEIAEEAFSLRLFGSRVFTRPGSPAVSLHWGCSAGAESGRSGHLIKTPSIAVRISNARAYWANQ